MGDCVGKPTLRDVEPRTFTYVNEIDLRARRKARNRPRKTRTVAGTYHCRDCPFTSLSIGRLRRERPNSSPLSIAERRSYRFSVRNVERFPAVVLADAGNSELLFEALLAISAPAKRARPAERIGSIVDIAEPCKPGRKRFKIRVAPTGPAAFPKLPGQIAAELGPSGCILADIAQRELVKPALVERRKRTSGLEA
jgi:hypothetical protein